MIQKNQKSNIISYFIILLIFVCILQYKDIISPPINCLGGDISSNESYSDWDRWVINGTCPSVNNYAANRNNFRINRTRSRTYKKTRSESNGGTCPGDDVKYTKQEEDILCPRDCSGNWGDWSSCNAVCPGNAANNRGLSIVNSSGERATQTRTYNINNEALYGGSLCNKENGTTEMKNCSRTCKVNCKGSYSDWDRWNNTCPAVNDYATDPTNFRIKRTRYRTYEKTRSESNGGTCQEANKENIIEIEDVLCPRDCSGNWGDWSSCNAVCPGNAANNRGLSIVNSSGERATQTRTYNINNEALYGGSLCNKENGTTEMKNCSNECPIDCTADVSWSECDATCLDPDHNDVDATSTGTRTKTFINTNGPFYNGAACPDRQPLSCSRTCKVNCKGSYSDWDRWNNTCPAVNDYATDPTNFRIKRTRYRTYEKTRSESNGGTCQEANKENIIEIEDVLCPRDCSGNWGDWGSCTSNKQVRFKNISYEALYNGFCKRYETQPCGDSEILTQNKPVIQASFTELIQTPSTQNNQLGLE